MKKLRKKGSIQDIMMIVVAIFVISIILIIVYKVSDSFNTEIQANSDIPTEGKVVMGNVNDMYPGIMDNGILIIMVGLTIAAFILATLVKVHPVFIVFFLIILGIIILICGAFSNTYQEIANNTEYTALANDLTFTSHIMEFLPFIVGILGSLLAIIMYKISQEQ